MARKRLGGGGEDAPQQAPVRYSILVPAELDARLQQVAEEKKQPNLSHLIREILETGVEMHAAGVSPHAGALPIEINVETREMLDLAATLHNVSTASLAQMLVAEYVGEFVRRGEERRNRFNELKTRVLNPDDSTPGKEKKQGKQHAGYRPGSEE